MTSVTGHHYKSTRVRGLAPWNPNPASMEVVRQVHEVLDEYRQYLPLTARQVFYRLVGAHGFDKTEKAYKRLLEYLNRARRAGRIPWSSIRDDGFDSTGGGGWDNPQQVIDSTIYTAERYKRDHQYGQGQYVEVWVEAAGMMPQVSRMIREHSVPVYSSGGFNSTTAKYESAVRIRDRWDGEDRGTRVLHIGDFDPSGVAIIDSLAADLDAFLLDMGVQYYDVAEFERVAVTPDQIDEYGVAGAPTKATEQRAVFDSLAVQAEALAPPQLEEIVTLSVLETWDQGVYEELLIEEADERNSLVEALRGLSL